LKGRKESNADASRPLKKAMNLCARDAEILQATVPLMLASESRKSKAKGESARLYQYLLSISYSFPVSRIN
jgi:hypothetical protein